MATTSASLYEQLFPLTTVMGQRVVENFSGDTLNERWTVTTTGSATVAMSDTVNGGVALTSTTTGEQAHAHFNSIHQFSSTASVFLAVVTHDIVTALRSDFGFQEGITLDASFAFVSADTDISTNYRVRTDDGTTTTATTTTLAYDTSAHIHKLELTASSFDFTSDNTLALSKTTNLPDSGQQPRLFNQSKTATTKVMNVRYVEIYNT